MEGSILDADGNWTAEEGTYRTMDLCRAHDLDPRDLRKLDSLNPSLVPIILTRRSCILLSILNIRALIKPDRVIIFSAPGTEDSETMKRFKAHLQANVRAGLSHAANVRAAGEGDRQATEEDLGLSYEHRALESILVITANGLEEEMAFVRRLVRDLLDSFEHDINRDNLRKLLHYSRRLAGFQSRAKYIKSTVDEVLDSDEDLSAMYLSDKLQGKPRALHDHEQLELLLESFTKQVEEIVSEIDTMVVSILPLEILIAAQCTIDAGSRRAHAGFRSERTARTGYQSLHGDIWDRSRRARGRHIRHELDPWAGREPSRILHRFWLGRTVRFPRVPLQYPYPAQGPARCARRSSLVSQRVGPRGKGAFRARKGRVRSCLRRSRGI